MSERERGPVRDAKKESARENERAREGRESASERGRGVGGWGGRGAKLT